MPQSRESTHPAGLIEEIAERIHAKIVAGDYAPGDRLKQDLIAEEFGVSRTPVREALSRLDAQGIVSQSLRRSATVNAPSPREVRERYQVRAHLEGLAAELAARQITEEQLGGLRKANTAFAAAAGRLRDVRARPGPADGARGGDQRRRRTQDWIDTNSRFHLVILEASGNAFLARVLQDASAGYVRFLMLTSGSETPIQRMEANITQHEAILAAIAAQDPTRARRVMVDHVMDGGSFVASWLERQAHNPRN